MLLDFLDNDCAIFAAQIKPRFVILMMDGLSGFLGSASVRLFVVGVDVALVYRFAGIAIIVADAAHGFHRPFRHVASQVVM